MAVELKSVDKVFFDHLEQCNVPEIRKMLADKCIDINTRNDRGHTPLHVAIRLGCIPLVDMFLREKDVVVDAKAYEMASDRPEVFCPLAVYRPDNWRYGLVPSQTGDRAAECVSAGEKAAATVTSDIQDRQDDLQDRQDDLQVAEPEATGCGRSDRREVNKLDGAAARAFGRPGNKPTAPHTLGVASLGGLMARIVARGDPLPAERSVEYLVEGAGPTITLYAGDGMLAAENAVAGRLTVGRPPGYDPGRRPDVHVIVTVRVDEHGRYTAGCESREAGRSERGGRHVCRFPSRTDDHCRFSAPAAAAAAAGRSGSRPPDDGPAAPGDSADRAKPPGGAAAEPATVDLGADDATFPGDPEIPAALEKKDGRPSAVDLWIVVTENGVHVRPKPRSVRPVVPTTAVCTDRPASAPTVLRTDQPASSPAVAIDTDPSVVQDHGEHDVEDHGEHDVEDHGEHDVEHDVEDHGEDHGEHDVEDHGEHDVEDHGEQDGENHGEHDGEHDVEDHGEEHGEHDGEHDGGHDVVYHGEDHGEHDVEDHGEHDIEACADGLKWVVSLARTFLGNRRVQKAIFDCVLDFAIDVIKFHL